ncbi:hypothetical protein F2P81_000270 [Scophthalmus maximus]|uniref:Uncharacterized protein n=1 Tax=Scophthalmus maximus TaxID=52904 RepID=A0A6A4TIR0_SCOMX|nr:hypothetical protein F2P81_000270 [Scophthalmus maximus]
MWDAVTSIHIETHLDYVPASQAITIQVSEQPTKHRVQLPLSQGQHDKSRPLLSHIQSHHTSRSPCSAQSHMMNTAPEQVQPIDLTLHYSHTTDRCGAVACCLQVSEGEVMANVMTTDVRGWRLMLFFAFLSKPRVYAICLRAMKVLYLRRTAEQTSPLSSVSVILLTAVATYKLALNTTVTGDTLMKESGSNLPVPLHIGTTTEQQRTNTDAAVH